MSFPDTVTKETVAFANSGNKGSRFLPRPIELSIEYEKIRKTINRIKNGIFSHSCHKGIFPAILVSGNFFTLGEDIFFFKATLFALFLFSLYLRQ